MLSDLVRQGESLIEAQEAYERLLYITGVDSEAHARCLLGPLDARGAADPKS